ncbi:MAG: hypothetical protein J5934_00355 [Succinivibrio sp.]|nr:hypothetical protein [Succinivibrio sp.]
MKKFSYLLASAFLALFIVGCASMKPITNRSELVPAGTTLQEVNSAIITAANSKGWSLKPNGNNSYIALHQRSNLSATVRIDYSESAYSISYVNATGFKTDANGNIHNNYNRWVNNLAVEIQNTLKQQANLRILK